MEKDGRWTVVFVDTGEGVSYGEQTSEEQLQVYRRNLDALLPTQEPRTPKTRPAKEPATTSSPPPQAVAPVEPEFEEIEILVTPPQPAKYSDPAISKEQYWAALTERLAILVVEEIKDGYGRDYTRTDALRKEIREIQSRASHAYPNWNIFQESQCSHIKLRPDPLLWPRVACDIAAVPGHDQRRLRYDIQVRLHQHELAYVKLADQVVDLLHRALTAIDTGKEILPKQYNLAPAKPLTPDVPPTLIEETKPAITRMVRVRKERKMSTTSIDQRARALEILNGAPTSFKEVSDLCSYYVLRTLGLSEGQEEKLRLICHELGERRRSPTEVQDTKIKSMMTDTRLSNGKVVYLDPWTLTELTDLAGQTKRLIESCPRHKPSDDGRCEEPSCFWRNRHNVLNWIEAHRGNDAAVACGEDLYDACLKYSEAWEPPKKEQPTIERLLQHVGELVDRVPP